MPISIEVLNNLTEEEAYNKVSYVGLKVLEFLKENKNTAFTATEVFKALLQIEKTIPLDKGYGEAITTSRVYNYLSDSYKNKQIPIQKKGNYYYYKGNKGE